MVVYDEFIAGVISGGLATLVCHPLDIVKTILQVNDGRKTRDYLSMGSKSQYIPILSSFLYNGYKSEGLKLFYRGLSANVLASMVSWGSYFTLYAICKNHIFSISSQSTVSFWEYFASSCISGAITLVVTNPLWLIKTRLLLQSNTSKYHYNNVFHGLMTIYRTDGILGLYKGFAIGLVGITHGGIQFAIYELLKNSFHTTFHSKPTWSHMDIFIMSTISKFVAIISTYPYQVIRSRIQDLRGDSTGQQYKNTIDVLSRIIRYEGWRGFYKGVFWNLIRVMPSTWITFTTYEYALSLLHKFQELY